MNEELLHQPPSRILYVAIPVLTSASMAISGVLLQLAAGKGADVAIMFGLGLAMANAPIGAYVALDRVSREWVAYWGYRRSVAEAHTIPEPEPEEWTEFVMPTGRKGYAKNETTNRLANAFGATTNTIQQVVMVNDDDEAVEQTVMVDVSWGVWTVAKRYQQVGGFSEGDWKKAKIFENLNQYRAVRDYMIKKHILMWKNIYHHNSGIEIVSPGGERTLRALARMKQPPSPIPVPAG